MNKTGIAITVTSNGMSRPVVANPGEWTRHICDIRPILGCIDPPCDSASQHPLIYMTFSATGTYIAVVREISGRAGDNVTAWLYIPDLIDIRGEEIAATIEHLDSLIKADILPDELELAEDFAECYATACNDSFPAFTSDPQGPLAWRRIGTDELDELAGTFRRRPYYAAFRGIILAGEGQSVSDAADLTAYSLDDIDTDTDTDTATDNDYPPSQPITDTHPVATHSHKGLCRQWQPYALGAMAGFILGLVTAWYIGGHYTSQTASMQTSLSPESHADSIRHDTVAAAPAGYTALQMASATAYLDTHKIWNKAEMDTIAPLAGLWDALNNCRYEAVAEYAARLDGSVTLKTVADTLAALSPHAIPGIHLNTDNTNLINVETYGSQLREAAKAIKRQ